MNKSISFSLLVILCLYPFLCGAQKKDTTAIKPVADSLWVPADVDIHGIDTFANYAITAYTDVYYADYTDYTRHGDFVKFPTISPRNNSLGLNDFQVSCRYDGDKIRGTATLQYGDIAQSAWSATYNNIQEAHAGVRLFNTLWLDGGFFKTHFGTENLLPVDNIASSLSTGTYYEPYYEAGLRLNYDPNPQLEINLFLLNGYNMFEDNNDRKSFGVGVTYKFNDYVGVGYTNYIGNDAPDSVQISKLRVAQNVFFNYHKKKLKIQAGADLYIQQHADITNSQMSGMAYSGLATVGYQLKPKLAIYGRGEVFSDANAILSPAIIDASNRLTGYKLWGATLGIEYKPVDNAYIRLETRRLQMATYQDIYLYDHTYVNYRYEVMVTAGISLTLLKGFETRN